MSALEGLLTTNGGYTMSKYNTVEVMEVPATISAHLKAYVAGFNTATKLDSGDEFLGGIPEADKYHENGTLEHNMFVFGYVEGLRARFTDGVVPCTYNREDNTSFIE
jgi:hypothetical protein